MKDISHISILVNEILLDIYRKLEAQNLSKAEDDIVILGVSSRLQSDMQKEIFNNYINESDDEQSRTRNGGVRHELKLL